MRVLFLHRLPVDVIVGGVAEYIQYIVPALAALGVETYTYNEAAEKSAGLQGPRVLPNGMRAFSGPYVRPHLFSFTQNLKPLLELCRKEKIDLIHAQGTYRSGYVAMRAFKKAGIPFVVTSHSDIVATNSHRMRRPSVIKRCREVLKSAAGVSHLTPMMADISHAIYDTSNKSSIIGNGIDMASWSGLNKLPEQDYMLGIGRLVPEKGFHIAIDAYAFLRQQGIKTSLVIAGCGEEEAALQNQARALNLNVVTDFSDFDYIPEASVVFTGYVRGEQKKKLVAACKLVLFPTQPALWEEPFGIVQIEAMASGKALIASDAVVTRYLQEFGLQVKLVPADNTQAWTQAMSDLLLDDAVRLQLGERNLKEAEQFDWQHLARLYKDFYAKACG